MLRRGHRFADLNWTSATLIFSYTVTSFHVSHEVC